MLRMKRKTLILTQILTAIAFIILVSVIMMSNKQTIDINLTTKEVNNIFEEKLPITKTIPVKVGGALQTKAINRYIKEVDVTINDVRTELKKDNAHVISNGTILLGDVKLAFKVDTNGKITYQQRTHEFFYSPRNIDVTTDKEPTQIIKEYIIYKQKERKGKVDTTITSDGNEVSFWQKAKNKIKETSKKALNATINGSESTALAYLDNEHYKHEINDAIMNKIKTVATQYLQNKKIYQLKDGDTKQELAKATLDDIKIKEGKVVIQLNVSSILKYGVMVLLIIIVTGVIVTYTIRNPKQVMFGCIEIVGVVAEASIMTVGAVAEGIGDIS